MSAPAVKASESPAAGPQTLTAFLVEAGLLDAAKLKYVERVRAKLTEHRPLVPLLEELGLTTLAAVRDALRARKLDVPLGELLLELGLIREADLRVALAVQKERPGSRLGRVLVENHALKEDELCEALAMQLGLERFTVDAQSAMELAASSNAAPGVLRAHDMVPVGRRDGAMLVALVDPLDRRAQDTAKRVFGPATVLGVASQSSIETALLRIELGRPRTSTSVSENAVVAAANQLIADAAHKGASDIHIEPTRTELRVRLRIDGVLATHKTFPIEMAPSLVSRFKVMASADITERRRHQDGRILYERDGVTLDVRFSSYVTLHGENLVMRLLNNRKMMLGIDQIGMAPRVLERFKNDALDTPSGVIVVTGPTGSGKTTTLYGAVDYLNSPNTCIITAEDPVEYVIEGIAQCSLNQKAHVTYEDTLKHMMRQDPDIIVIGEIRDQLSAETAIQAALTGHKVLTTFHTEDSIGGLLRLLNMNIEAFLISSTVVSVVAQRLARRVCSACGEERVITAQEIRRLGYEPKDLHGLKVRQGRGCTLCQFSGHKGRLPIFELLVLSEQVKEALIARKPSFEIRRISTETTGLVTMMEEGIVRALNGETSIEEVLRVLPRLAKPRPIDTLRKMLGD